MSKKIQNKTLNNRKTRAASVLPVTKSSTESFSCKNSIALYRFVYSTRTSLLMAFMLLISFFVQGVQNVYASENLPLLIPETVASDSISDTNTDTVVDELPEATVVEDSTSDTTVEAEEVDNADDSTTDPQESEEVTGLEEAQNPDKVDFEISSSSESNSDDTSSPEDIDISETDDSVDSTATNTPVLVLPDSTNSDSSEDVDETTADDTEEDVPQNELNHESVSVTESDSAFSFTSDECTQLATGSFYCQKPQKNVLDDALFSAPDEDGDTEIFLVRGGVQVQVTHNNVDDAAPYYDQNSNTIVWHRLINDRYQIISYDVDTQKEVQLTQTSENNMEPTRQGDYTVWQRWIDGGWNIILFDGNKETQITRTTAHNVAPYIHGSLIVWNRHDTNGVKTIEMYDIASKTYVTVDDPDGMSVSNPRMVFVYDSLHPNGDIVTKGYDVLAHKFIDLDSLPRELPEEIPDTDSTGETRALIQSKPSIKSEVVTKMTGSSTPPIIDLPPAVEVATSTDAEHTLDLSGATSTSEVSDNPGALDTPEDLVVSNEILPTEEVASPEVVSEASVEEVPVELDIEIEEFVMPVDEVMAANSVQE